MRISDFLEAEVERIAAAEDRRSLIAALPTVDDLVISETLVAVPGAVFYHLQISFDPMSGRHVGRVFTWFDTTSALITTDPQVQEEIALSRDEVFDNQDALLEIVANMEC
ncbi:hypothetical protein LF599_07645 [Pseudodesulfovibrio thermohalotolerans]|uniref:hypothetical protein n=1 Tax=Pseudodesulfovibrio thermohalotolerans TaxID=2880651 RepID=UPI002441B411|nr:hypothetical protein [Pseudodesulfovibrio thermohalotolerans]WFS64028.1 hypothetical protein LF599_07645 [Pseudodesulfovibrio thermohalotolerans]